MKHVYRFTKYFVPQYKPVIFCVKDDKGEMLMIAPVKKNRFKRFYKMLGDIQGCGLADFVYNPKLSHEERLRCIECLFGKIGCKALLRRLEAEGPLAEYLEARAGKKSQDVCVSIKYSDSFDEHFATFSSSVRQNVRTAYNRLKRDGKAFDLRFYDSETPMPNEVRAKVMELYLGRLFSKYKKYKGLRLWYQRLVYMHAKHDTKSLFALQNQYHAILYIDGEIAGFMSGFKDYESTKLFVPRLAICDSFRFYSPGYIMLCETMKIMIEKSSIRELDLSRGDEKYKLDLGGGKYFTSSFRMR
jgi:hypothetical protein